MKLLTKNSKLEKGEGEGWISVGIQMAPANLSGYEVCKWRSKGCSAVCLNKSGNGWYPKIQESRKNKTKFFFEQPELFKEQLVKEFIYWIKKANTLGMKLACRLNVLSDIEWETVKIKDDKNIFELFPMVQFYDYTKSISRVIDNNIPNYSLTYSRKETPVSEIHSLMALNKNKNVAIVFNVKRTKPLPTNYKGYSVIDGDKTDLRFLDPKGVIVGLRTKGKAHSDKTGFVVSV